jgi:hypothetical protein
MRSGGNVWMRPASDVPLTARRSNSISAGSTEAPGRLRADHQIDATDPAEAFGPRSEIHRIAWQRVIEVLV